MADNATITSNVVNGTTISSSVVTGVSITGDVTMGGKGADGTGIPSGGTVGQVLVRTSTGAAWQSLASSGGALPIGGNGGDQLEKATSTDSDATWQPVPTAPSYAKLGINMGNEIDGGTAIYPTAQRLADLLYLRKFVSRIRVKIEYHQDLVGLGYTQTLALQAKALGFYVSWGTTSGGGGSGITQADYDLWKNTDVYTAAAWAAANGIDEFQIGNEEDLWASLGNIGAGAVTDQNVRDDVKAIATSLKATYPHMRLVYSTAEGNVAGWDSDGTGDLDGFGVNVYNADFPGTILYFSTLSFGSIFFVTEWNADGGYGGAGESDADYRADLLVRLQTLKDSNLVGYFYTWRDDSDFGIKNADDTLRPGWEEIVGLDAAAVNEHQHPLVRPHTHAATDVDGSSSASLPADGEVLFTESGAIAGSTQMTYDHPTHVLTVTNEVISTSLQYSGGTPGASKVLTSDASGNATWQTPSSGFANPMTTLGDTMYESSAPAAARLAGNTTTTKKYLSQTGNGTISAIPAWAQIAVADMSGFGTGVATALAVNVGSAGAPVVLNGALGTPSSGTATNLTGTAASLTAGNVTTNANLTGPITSSGNATSIASQTGTGTKFVVDTSPTLVTPTLGVATATSVNKVAVTAPATSATLTIPDGVTLTGPASSGTAMTLGNTETVTGVKTFGSTGAVGRLKLAGTTSGTTVLDASATASGTITVPAATDTLMGKATTDTMTNKTYDTAGTGNSFSINGVAATANTGTGAVARAAAPTFTTPTLGAATATSVNKMAITAPATSSTLAVADGKTATINNTLTLAGTDSTTMTFPSTTATVARTDAAQTFTGTQTFAQIVTTANAITASANAATVPITSRVSNVTNNSAATLTITITTTSAVDGMLVIVRVFDFSAAAQTITWVNTENSTTTVPATSNGSTTLPRTVGFQFNSATTKWRCILNA